MSERSAIDVFYRPKSVAIIGAKNRASGFGARLPRFLLELGVAAERLHLVNPREKEIDGLPVYPTVKDVPGDVDLAIVIVPAPAVPGVLGDCVEKGVAVVNVQSAGFAETGADGAKAQEEMGRLARESGIRIMGPNCVGVVNVPGRFSTCQVDLDAIRPGGVSVVAQSGVFGNVLMDWAPSQDLALCKLATIGNRADVDETDMLEYLGRDPATRVIVIYLESVKDGRRFIEVARRASLEKPVLVYKSGETEAGKKATLSHTGSLSGTEAIFDGACRQAGIIRGRDLFELFDMARAFEACPLPKGRRALVVTGSGSQGAMAADRLVQCGLELPDMTARSVAEIRKNAPDWMNVGNPLDIGPSGLFTLGMKLAMTDSNIDAVITMPIIPWTAVKLLLDVDPEAVSKRMFIDPALIEKATERTLLISLMGHPDWVKNVRRFFGPHAPVMTTPQNAARALAAMCEYREWREAQKA
ncbi:CoA-binding protein [bacterium]|nr:CoA-binding protein [bacterium]